MRDYKTNQDEPANEENRRRSQVGPEMIYPSAGDWGNCEHKRNDKDALAMRDSENTSQQHQRKQTGYNKFATFNFLDERRSDEEESERNKKLHRREATQSRSVGRRFPKLYRPRSFVRFSPHNLVKSEMFQLWSSF